MNPGSRLYLVAALVMILTLSCGTRGPTEIVCYFCPVDPSKLDSVVRLDLGEIQGIPAELNAEIKASMMAAWSVMNLSSAALQRMGESCNEILRELQRSIQPGGISACQSASNALREAREQLGPGVHITFTITPPSCRSAVESTVDCMGRCQEISYSGADRRRPVGSHVASPIVQEGCQIFCSSQTIYEPECKPAVTRVEVTGAQDEGVSSRYQRAIEQNLSGLFEVVLTRGESTQSFAQRSRLFFNSDQVKSHIQAFAGDDNDKYHRTHVCHSKSVTLGLDGSHMLRALPEMANQVLAAALEEEGLKQLSPVSLMKIQSGGAIHRKEPQ